MNNLVVWLAIAPRLPAAHLVGLRGGDRRLGYAGGDVVVRAVWTQQTMLQRHERNAMQIMNITSIQPARRKELTLRRHPGSGCFACPDSPSKKGTPEPRQTPQMLAVPVNTGGQPTRMVPKLRSCLLVFAMDEPQCYAVRKWARYQGKEIASATVCMCR